MMEHRASRQIGIRVCDLHITGVTPPDTRVGGKSSFIPSLPTTAAMIERSDLSSSNRTLSASSLKDRLSKLSVTPLRPVAALQARVECGPFLLSLFLPLTVFPFMPPVLFQRASLGCVGSRRSRLRYGPT
jgi:hypothetical protein